MTNSSAPEKLDAQVLDTLQATQQVTMTPKVLDSEGAGKAYLSTSQTIAIAIQDAADNMRNLSTISSTAIGVALAKCLADPDKVSSYAKAISQAQDVTQTAAADFKTLGTDAAGILTQFQAVAAK